MEKTTHRGSDGLSRPGRPACPLADAPIYHRVFFVILRGHEPNRLPSPPSSTVKFRDRGMGLAVQRVPACQSNIAGRHGISEFHDLNLRAVIESSGRGRFSPFDSIDAHMDLEVPDASVALVAPGLVRDSGQGHGLVQIHREMMGMRHGAIRPGGVPHRGRITVESAVPLVPRLEAAHLRHPRAQPLHGRGRIVEPALGSSGPHRSGDRTPPSPGTPSGRSGTGAPHAARPRSCSRSMEQTITRPLARPAPRRAGPAGEIGTRCRWAAPAVRGREEDRRSPRPRPGRSTPTTASPSDTPWEIA